MKYSRIWVLIVSLFTLFACSNPNGFSIKGSIKNGKYKMVYLEKITGQVLLIDSTEISSNGEYKFVGPIEQKSIYRLNFDNQKAIDLILESSSNVEVSFDALGPMSDYEIKGSEISLTLKEVNGILYQTFKKINEIQNEFAEKRNDPNIETIQKELENKYNTTISFQSKSLKNFISKNKEVISDFYALSYLNMDDDFSFVDSVFVEHQLQIASYEYTQQFYDKYLQIKKIAVGSIALDFKLNQPDGSPISLSSLRGKVVLIDFWASWCGPCRQENPNIVGLYNKFKDKGFTIFAVSLDKNKEDWLAAIMKDGLTWYHVSELKFWDSEAARLYKIEAIPSNVLIDQDGRIIAKNANVEQLEKYIKKLLP